MQNEIQKLLLCFNFQPYGFFYYFLQTNPVSEFFLISTNVLLNIIEEVTKKIFYVHTKKITWISPIEKKRMNHTPLNLLVYVYRLRVKILFNIKN